GRPKPSPKSTPPRCCLWLTASRTSRRLSNNRKRPVFLRRRAFSSGKKLRLVSSRRPGWCSSFPGCGPARTCGRREFASRDRLGELFSAADEGPNPFGEQSHVERLAEGLVEDRAVESARVVFVAQEADQHRFGVFGV